MIVTAIFEAKAGKVGLAPLHDFSSKVPAAYQAKLKAITPKVLNGTVKTGVKL